MSTEQARFLCRHILADGHRCRAACLRHEEFCYYHHASRRPVADPAQRKSRRASFTLPRIEDRASIQAPVNDVIARIAANDIDPRRAGRLLFAIQIASRNMPRPPALQPVSSDPKSKYYDDEAPGPVEEIVLHPTFGEIAPRAEIAPPVKRKSLCQTLREEMEALEARNIAEFGPYDDDSRTPTPTGPETSDLQRELREAREELAHAKAQLAESRAETLHAEKCMVWHMERQNEALTELETLKSTAGTQPETLPRLQAVAAPPLPCSDETPSLSFHEPPLSSFDQAALSSFAEGGGSAFRLRDAPPLNPLSSFAEGGGSASLFPAAPACTLCHPPPSAKDDKVLGCTLSPM